MHDLWVDLNTALDVLPGVSQDFEILLSGEDAMMEFIWHREYRGPVPVEVKDICGGEQPAIVDGRNMIDPETRSGVGFVCREIGRSDKMRHRLISTGPMISL